jgi:hypothetical protein
MSNKDIYAELSFASELKQVGIDGLRAHVEAGTWKTGSPVKHGEAVVAIGRFDKAAASASSAIRDAREARTLAIAEDALSIAKDANRIASEDLAVARDSAKSARKSSNAAERNSRWAMYAAITAVLAAIIAIKDQIYALTSGLF